MSIVLNPVKLICISSDYYNHSSQKTEQIISYWKSMTWEEYNKIFAKSMRNFKAKNGDISYIDFITHRDLKLKLLLKKITIDGDSVNITNDVIDNMPASLAGHLISIFEKYTEASPDALKNLESVAHSFFKGKKISGLVPQYIYEHILAHHYGWSLSEIRAMSNYDFQAHLRVCLARESIENEFKVSLAGKSTKTPTGGKETLHKKFDPLAGDFV